jgi:anti-sigma regulatory factor (Ser/Thr protein kinase)
LTTPNAAETPAGGDIPYGEFRPEDLCLKLELRLPADLVKMSESVEGIMKVLLALGCGNESEVEISLREALANAIVHGCDKDASKTVECEIACNTSRALLIQIRDPGVGFDTSTLPDPKAGENLQIDHGRGVYMILRLMDQVVFADQGRELRMYKRPNGCGE